MKQNISELKNILRNRMMLEAAEMAINLNKNTKSAYSRIWQNFIDYIDSIENLTFQKNKEQINSVLIISDIKVIHIRNFLSMDYPNYSSYNQARSAILKLLEALQDKYPEESPNVEKIKRQIRPKKNKPKEKLYLTKKELMMARDMAHVLYPRRHIRKRNILMFDMLMQTWMRVDELAQIKIGDINIQNGTIAVRGKGASACNNEGDRHINNYLYIRKNLSEQIIEYIERFRIQLPGEKPVINIDDKSNKSLPLFTGQKGKPLNATSIKKIISDIIKTLYKGKSLPNGHGPHCIRRSMATIKYKKCKDILLIQKMLRHSNPETTRIYLNIDEDEIKKGFLED